MNILEFLKRLFKKENNNANHLINISDSFVLPTREIFKDNPRMLHMIESYKGDYKKVLSDKKLLFSMDLTNNINEDIRMYSELITNIFTREEKTLSAVETKVKMFYKVNKLNLYKEEISKLNLECTARLVALLEIFNERKKFMSKHKKDALLFAMNNLTNALVVFEAQRGAIEAERTAFLNSYAMITLDDEKSYEEEKKKFIKERLTLLQITMLLFNKYVKSDNLVDILALERELEIYAYKNKDEAEDIKYKISYCYNLLDEANGIQEIYDSIDTIVLGKKALIFYYFGKGLINLEDITRFYEVKFTQLLFMFGKDGYSQIKCFPLLQIEKDVFKNCVYKKIQKIVTGKNPVIEKLFGNDSRKAIKYIIEELKTKEHVDVEDNLFDFTFDNGKDSIKKKIDAEEILNSDKLNFLLCFEQEDGFIKYLEKIVVPREWYKYDINFFEEVFSWKSSLPISTLYEVIRLLELSNSTIHELKKLSHYSRPTINEAYYNLYVLYQKHLDYYQLPWGINSIEGSVIFDQRSLVKNMRYSARGKKLVLPDSLKRFNSDIFSPNSVKELVLSDHIESVSIEVLNCAPLNTLIIPASLQEIVANGFHFSQLYDNALDIIDETSPLFRLELLDFKNLETLIFKDYENSKILYNTDMLRYILKNTLYIEVDEFGNKILKFMLKTIILKSMHENVVFDFDISDVSLKITEYGMDNKGIYLIRSIDIERLFDMIRSKYKNYEDGKTLIKKI